MNKTLVFGIVVIVAIGAGIYLSSNSSKNDATIADEKTDDPAVGKNDTLEEDKIMKAGTYEAYASGKLARAETGAVVLFFHAAWCPSCRALNADIENNMSAIPEGISILKTDYDKETELKKQYGITYQHTLVQVDKDGNMIKKWSGSPTLTSLVAQIQ